MIGCAVLRLVSLTELRLRSGLCLGDGITPAPCGCRSAETNQQQDTGRDGPTEPGAAPERKVGDRRFLLAEHFRCGGLEAHRWKRRFGSRGQHLLVTFGLGERGLTSATLTEVVP